MSTRAPQDDLDDHLEAVIEGRNDRKIIVVAMRRVARIVDKYGGFCLECGPLGPDHVPFDWLFGFHVKREGWTLLGADR